MALKNPLLFRALTNPETFLGMHMTATLINGGVCFILGLMTEFMWGIAVGAGIQVYIRFLTHQDPYFLEVWETQFLRLKKTKRLQRGRGSNRYAV